MTHSDMVLKFTRAFGKIEPPIAIYYSDTKLDGAYEWNCEGGHFCHISQLASVRSGVPLLIDGENPGCPGAAYYLGWVEETRPGFECFLSHNAEGKGERFFKTPELARSFINNRVFIPATARYCIFQRLQNLPEEITPDVVAIFAEPDQIGGLVVLANYDRTSQENVISPWTSGCGSVVHMPRLQSRETEMKAVLGMFDPSARPKVEKSLLTFSTPYSRFVEMIENIPDSFLEIEPWTAIKNR